MRNIKKSKINKICRLIAKNQPNKKLIKEGFVLNIDDYATDGKVTMDEFKHLKSTYGIFDDIDSFGDIAQDWYGNFIDEKNKDFKIMVTLDDKEYTRKLNSRDKEDLEEIKNINNRIGSKGTIIDLCTFLDMVGNKGCSFCPAVFESYKDRKFTPRRKDTFLRQQVFALDFDEGIAVEEVLSRAYKYKILPMFIYKTLSCDDIKLNKFRVVWVADFIANDMSIAENIIKLLMIIFPEADKMCKDCCRLFFGGKGIIYKAPYPYLERLSLTDLSDAVNQLIKCKYSKDRLSKMREISKDTGIILNGGLLDIQEIKLTRSKIRKIGRCVKPKDWNISIRFYISLKEYEEILGKKTVENEDANYLVIRKLDAYCNTVYFIRVSNKKINTKIKENKQVKGDTIYKSKSNLEYKIKKKPIRGITREMLCEKCQLIRNFANDVYYLRFNELFGICTNLINIEGRFRLF